MHRSSLGKGGLQSCGGMKDGMEGRRMGTWQVWLSGMLKGLHLSRWTSWALFSKLSQPQKVPEQGVTRSVFWKDPSGDPGRLGFPHIDLG